MRLSAWCGWIVTACAVLVPLYAYLGPQGSPLLIAQVGVFCILAFRVPADQRVGAGLICLIVAWAAASTLWSPFLPDDIEANTALKLVLQAPIYWAAICAGARVEARGSKRVAWVLTGALSLTAVVLIADSFLGAAIYQAVLAAIGEPMRADLAQRNVARAAFVLALMMWTLPAAGLGRIGWAALGLCAAAVLVASFLLRADAPAIALVLAGLAFLAVSAWRKGATLVLAAGAGLMFLTAPFLFRLADAGGLIAAIDRAAPLSWQQRLGYWRAAAGHIFEKPLAGWGLDASRVFPTEITLHPHDGPLQVWLELGAVGAVLAAAFWAWLFLRARSAAEGKAAAAAAAAISYLTFSAVSFGVWQEWQLAWGALAACFFAALPAGRPGSREST